MADHTLTILDECRVAPPPGTVGERCLPLTFFDTLWLPTAPQHQLFMYEYTHPKTHFTQTLLPTLKTSLSIALKHFYPFSSNLLVFPDSKKPEIRHQEGDSVAFTVAESTLDFDDLVGNHPRSCHKFHNLVPRLGPSSKVSLTSSSSSPSSSSSNCYVTISLFAVQVTLFPNSGFSIGLTNLHSLCDASTKFDFLKLWTTIAKHDGADDELLLANAPLPFYGRVIEYPDSLDGLYINKPWIESVLNADKYQPLHVVSYADDLVRGTFVLTRQQLNGLKNRLMSSPTATVEYASSFSVACAYVWTCIVKSRAEVAEKKDNDNENDDVEKFKCLADWRARMNPPLPRTYFGNCVGPCIGTPTKSKLLASEIGFVTAAELIGKTISESVKKDVIKDAETWIHKFTDGVRATAVAESPKFKLYDTDFGWGKPTKCETISIDYNGSISFNVCRDSPQDFEMGLSLPTKQMDAFIAIFGKEVDEQKS